MRWEHLVLGRSCNRMLRLPCFIKPIAIQPWSRVSHQIFNMLAEQGFGAELGQLGEPAPPAGAQYRSNLKKWSRRSTYSHPLAPRT